MGESYREIYHPFPGKRAPLDDITNCLLNRWGQGPPGTADHNPQQDDQHKFF
jgi:hypothetical protein